MSLMHSEESPERSHLLRKVILLFLLTAALALGLVLLFREMSKYPVWLKEMFATLCMAVAAGFGSRFIIRNRLGFVRFVAAMAAYVAGLHLLGLASSWKYGMGPVEFWAKETDWDGLVQLAIGFFLLLMVFRAWRRTQPSVSEAAISQGRSVAPVDHGAYISPRANAQSKLRMAGRPKTSTSHFSWMKIGGSGRKKIKAPRSIAHSKARERDLPLVLNKPSRSKRRGVFRSKPQVKLALVEEHRCPYCLDLVNRTDKRGTVECEVCHTLHHKDCWEITGMCQVPHLNT